MPHRRPCAVSRVSYHLAARLIRVHPVVAIPRATESSHLLIVGDTGTGNPR
jgi:hypothetical protein